MGWVWGFAVKCDSHLQGFIDGQEQIQLPVFDCGFACQCLTQFFNTIVPVKNNFVDLPGCRVVLPCWYKC